MAIKIYTLLMLSLSFSVYSQNVTLLKNFNPKVKELKHSLNDTKDSLDLSCKSKIIKVDIFNEDYEQTFDIKDFNSLIPLQDLPIGKFVVDVQLIDKIVEMHIIKYSNTDNSIHLNKNEIVEGNGMMLDDELKVIKSPPNYSIESLLRGPKTNKTIKEKQKFYWISQDIHNGNSSCKSMKLVSEVVAKKMILKNKLETKTSYGKFNKLTVWEVYDSAKFMEQQTQNPEYINSVTSKLFNVKPYYITTENLVVTVN